MSRMLRCGDWRRGGAHLSGESGCPDQALYQGVTSVLEVLRDTWRLKPRRRRGYPERHEVYDVLSRNVNGLGRLAGWVGSGRVESVAESGPVHISGSDMDAVSSCCIYVLRCNRHPFVSRWWWQLTRNSFKSSTELSAVKTYRRVSAATEGRI